MESIIPLSDFQFPPLKVHHFLHVIKTNWFISWAFGPIHYFIAPGPWRFRAKGLARHGDGCIHAGLVGNGGGTLARNSFIANGLVATAGHW